MANGDVKNLQRRTTSDRLSSNPEYGGYKQRLASMVHKFYDKNGKKLE